MGHEFLGEALEGRVVLLDHLAEAGEGGVGLAVDHLVGHVEQAQDRFPGRRV